MRLFTSAMHTRSAALFIALLSLSAACASTSTMVHTTGAGVLTPSVGPVAVGPLSAARSASIEGSIQVAAPLPVRASEAGEVRAVTTVARARASYTIGERVEVGLAGQVTNTSSALTTRDGTLAAPSRDQTLFGGGVQVRALIVGDATLGFGVQGEVALYEAPYAAHYEYTVTRRNAAILNHYDETSHGVSDAQSTTVLVEPSLGAFVAFTPLEHLRIVAGGTFGTRHTVTTSDVVTSQCTGNGCSTTPELEAPFESEAQLTGHISAGYEIGRVTLLAQFAVTAFGDAPVGGTLGVRVTP